MEEGKNRRDPSFHYTPGLRVAAVAGEGRALGGHTDDAYGVGGAAAAATLLGASANLL